jgi:hypothetical protein
MPIPSQPTTNISLGPTLSPTDRSISDEFTELPSTDYAPYSISEYYRGAGAASPSYLKGVADHPINASIPTSGPISFSQFNGGSIVLKYVITSSTQNLNLFDYASSPFRSTDSNFSRGYYQGKRYVANQPSYGIEFVINPGVIIGSATRTQTALVTGTNGASGWHPTVQIRLVNQGLIVGAGGPGTAPSGINGGAGLSGGTGIEAQRTITIQNAGTISGGAGGGGGGGWALITQDSQFFPPFTTAYSGGGGGGGAGQSVGTGYVVPGQPSPLAGLSGSNAPSNSVGGAGGAGAPGGYAGAGGAGGSRGTPDLTGTAGQAAAAALVPVPQKSLGTGGAGGAAGFYVKGNANITWQAPGTQQGQVQPTT